MTIDEALKIFKSDRNRIGVHIIQANDEATQKFNAESMQALTMAIKSLEAWEKIDDDIASLQDIYSIGGSDTEKAIWENLQAVRKTIHEYLKEVSK